MEVAAAGKCSAQAVMEARSGKHAKSGTPPTKMIPSFWQAYAVGTTCAQAALQSAHFSKKHGSKHPLSR